MCLARKVNDALACTSITMKKGKYINKHETDSFTNDRANAGQRAKVSLRAILTVNITDLSNSADDRRVGFATHIRRKFESRFG